MDRQGLENQILEIAKDIFRYDGELTLKSSSSEIKSWDSMNQMQLLATLEKTFSVKFKIKEIIKFGTIGDIVTCVAEQLNIE